MSVRPEMRVTPTKCGLLDRSGSFACCKTVFKQSSSPHSQPSPVSACYLSGLLMATVMLFQGGFRGQFAK